MTFNVENIGPISNAGIELGDLTIICGKNNTGKTYLTYTLATFLKTIKQNLTLPIEDCVIDDLINNGEVSVELERYAGLYIESVNNIMPQFRNNLPRFMSMHPSRFVNANVSVSISQDELISKLALAPNSANTTVIKITANTEIEVHRQCDSTVANLALINKASSMPHRRLVANAMSFIMARMFDDVPFAPVFPDVFAVTCERTGAMLFRDELARMRFENYVRENNIERHSIRNNAFSEYQRPIADELNFVLDLQKISKRRSPIAESNPELITMLDEISGGSYSIDSEKNQIGFHPINMPELHLTLQESSSTVRSLAVLNFYIRHKAKPGELLIFDEPELNLHPENQRKLARFLAMLVNAGIKVFVTTHSDYIVRELNALMRLSRVLEVQRKEIQERYRIHASCLISEDRVKVYLLNGDGIAQVVFDPIFKAFAVPSFDNTIEEFNNLYNDIRHADNYRENV